MPQTFSTPAIALLRRPWREEDSLVTVYTLERGKLQLMVKGAKRLTSRMTAHMEPLTLLELMVIIGKNRPQAAAASSRSLYPKLKGDFDKINAAGFGVSRFNRLLKEDSKDETLFYLLSDFLALLNEAEASAEWYDFLAKMFLLKTLSHLGYAPSKEQFKKGGLDEESAKTLERLSKSSLYEVANISFSKNSFSKINHWLDRWIRVTIENAL